MPAEGTRLLIAAGTTVASRDELPAQVRELIEEASEILVVSPVLTSKLHLWTSDTDRAGQDAEERLAVVLGDVDSIGSHETRGAVGDEVPLTAFDDAVRTFQPDQIVIALRSGGEAAWQERGLADQVRAAFGL